MFGKSDFHFFCSYNVISLLLGQFGLVIKHGKTEIIQFSRSYTLYSPLLDLNNLRKPILYPKEIWQYLEFIFNRKLMFQQHIMFYSNKALLTIKCMKMLSNSLHGINPQQKQLLYRPCVLPIVLYRFSLWYYNNALLVYSLRKLRKMQRRVAL